MTQAFRETRYPARVWAAAALAAIAGVSAGACLWLSFVQVEPQTRGGVDGPAASAPFQP
jgi:hypothetical protein